jgi:hypothetical protein
LLGLWPWAGHTAIRCGCTGGAGRDGRGASGSPAMETASDGGDGVAPMWKVDEVAKEEGSWPETLTGERKPGVDGNVEDSRARLPAWSSTAKVDAGECLVSGEVEEGGWLCSLGADGVSRRQLRLGRAR